jgi:hypothetical protein
MPLIKKRDVKTYFAAKGTRGSGIHVVPTSPTDATDFSGNEPAVVERPAVDFNRDFIADHSSPCRSTSDSNAPADPQASAALGRVRV